MEIVTRTAGVLQAVLSTTAVEIGQRHQLIRRQREFTASSLLATFVLGFLQRPCPTWEQLALVARQLGARVTPQAVEQRVTAALRDSLRELWQATLTQAICARPRMEQLLSRFTHVLVGDSTSIRLTDALAAEFPGCGHGRAFAKCQIVWDMVSGGLWNWSWEAGKQNDSTSAVMHRTPPAGSLLLFDLGYFSLDRFRDWQQAGAHWISRGISDLLVWSDGQSQDLHDWLNTQPNGPVDQWIVVGGKRLACRVVALRAPAEVVARRRQKAYEKASMKGRRPTTRHLATCGWTVFLTSCPQELLSWQEVVVAYRVRWQIELLFKLWKSHHRIEHHRSTDPVRQLVELYARLTAVTLQHWLLLTTGWDDSRLSLVKAARLIRDQVPQLIASWHSLPDLIQTLACWQQHLGKLARIASRRKQPSNWQLLANPDMLTYNA